MSTFSLMNHELHGDDGWVRVRILQINSQTKIFSEQLFGAGVIYCVRISSCKNIRPFKLKSSVTINAGYYRSLVIFLFCQVYNQEHLS